MKCRFCGKQIKKIFIDLTNSPPSNSFLSLKQLNEPEIFYPLKLFVCEFCFLVQIPEYKKYHEIFDNNYIYFSSFSKSWLDHANKYVDMITKRYSLNSNSFVIEIASNDGYLLQFFKNKSIPCLGIEPSLSTAKIAKKRGIEVIEDFFNTKLASSIASTKKADLIIGNNVLAHVPNINDFVSSLKIILKPNGIITLEFPHLLNLIEQNQFDTIYHEHFSYFSFHTVKMIFLRHGLTIFDVEELDTHGGSLRIFATHSENSNFASDNVKALEIKEETAGIKNIEYYMKFSDKINIIKNTFLQFLIKQRGIGKKIAAYGAAAKGNTLFNYCGIKKDLVSFVADISPYKQGKFLPGCHIPVVSPKIIKKEKPDIIIIIPWNIKEEIISELNYTKNWGAKFVIPIPRLEILS